MERERERANVMTYRTSDDVQLILFYIGLERNAQVVMAQLQRLPDRNLCQRILIGRDVKFLDRNGAPVQIALHDKTSSA